MQLYPKLTSLNQRNDMKSDKAGTKRFRRRFWGETTQDSKSPLHSTVDDSVRLISERRDCSKEVRDEPTKSDSEGSIMLEPVVVSIVEESAVKEDDDDEVNLTTLESLALRKKCISSTPLQPKGLFGTETTCCADRIIHRSFIEQVFCGHDNDQILNSLEDPLHSALPRETRNRQALRRRRSSGNDPKAQEAIECMFASQLDSKSNKIQSRNFSIVAPSGLQQSFISCRTYSTLKNPLIQQNSTSANAENRVLNLIPRNSFHEIPALASISDNSSNSISCTGDDSHCSTLEASDLKRCCQCESWFSPVLTPDLWPQRPLLLRPTPDGGTRVKGVRYAGSHEYIWEENGSNIGWHDELRRKWNLQKSNTCFDAMCPRCVVLPINNGNEADGEALVTDFESDLFDGSLLVRIRGAEGTTREAYDDTKGYFSDVNRKYQVVVQGRFKKSVSWTECVSGIRYVLVFNTCINLWIFLPHTPF
jgi:Protein of unknown function (DUF1769)